MSAAIALAMTRADVLKLRKKRSTIAWASLPAIAPVVIFFLVKAIEHSSNPAQYGVAGGLAGFQDGLRLLAMIFGPLAAILVGAEAGAGDMTSGVFRDLVVTGRSRAALFASRVPAALVVMWTISLVAYAILVLASLLLAGNGPTPDAATIVNGLGFTLLALGVVCVLAVGLGALTGSRPGTIVALVGWHMVASPLLASVESLGSARDGIFSQAILHFSPLHLGDRGEVSMSSLTAVVVLLVWLGALSAAGAWRTRTIDA